MILRVTPTKTEQTSAASIEVDLSECPMVVEELSKIPVENRVGPLIVNPSTGLPYRQWYFRDLWRKCARVSGIPATAGTATCGPGETRRDSEQEHRWTTERKSWAIRQCRGSPRKCTTATNWKRHDGCQGREWPTGPKT